jgi:hypothetical protein
MNRCPGFVRQFRPREIVDQSVTTVEGMLMSTSDEAVYAPWRMPRGDEVISAIPLRNAKTAGGSIPSSCGLLFGIPLSIMDRRFHGKLLIALEVDAVDEPVSAIVHADFGMDGKVVLPGGNVHGPILDRNFTHLDGKPEWEVKCGTDLQHSQGSSIDEGLACIGGHDLRAGIPVNDYDAPFAGHAKPENVDRPVV